MSKLRIKDAPLLPDINGEEKIPTGGRGDYSVSVDQIKTYARGGLPQQIEDHINDTENPHQVSKSQVGLGEVDNTSDVDKPISTATQEALDLKADKTAVHPKSATLPTYYTKEDGVNSVTGVADGAYFNVRSSSDELYVDEYQNVGGSAVATGKSYLSALGVQLQEKPASTIKDPSGKNQQEINAFRTRAFPSVLDNVKVTGSGVSDDSEGLQEYFRGTDDNRKPSIFFPSRNHEYLIQSPLVVQEPVMIYGDKGATYNRGDGKTGNILIGEDTDFAFNLGNERTYNASIQDVDNHISKNPSDNWAIKNVGFKPADGVAPRTKTAMRHTTKNNGPDRGLLLREVSGTRLKNVLHITNQGMDTQLATLIVENCCISNNELSVLAEGLVFGLRFVGNQAEQNQIGAVWGTFSGGVTIEDNMLEGQPDPVKIMIPDAGNRVQVSLKRNYFEVNRGEAIMEVASSNHGSIIETGPNFFSRTTTTFPKHYVLLKGNDKVGGNPSIGYQVVNKDPYPISLHKTATVQLGSDIFNQVKYFRQSDSFNEYGQGGRVFTSNLNSLQNRDDNVSSRPFDTSFESAQTTLGNIRYAPITTTAVYRQIEISAATGDVLSINFLVSLSDDADGTFNPRILGGASGVVSEGAFSIRRDIIGEHGGIFLITLAVVAQSSVASIRAGIIGTLSAGSAKLYGVSVHNYGQRVSGESIDVYPSIPLVTPATTSAKVTYDPPSIVGGGSVSTTVALPGVGAGDTVVCGFSNDHADLELIAKVSTPGIVTVKFKNIGTSAIDLASGTLTVKSI